MHRQRRLVRSNQRFELDDLPLRKAFRLLDRGKRIAGKPRQSTCTLAIELAITALDHERSSQPGKGEFTVNRTPIRPAGPRFPVSRVAAKLGRRTLSED